MPTDSTSSVALGIDETYMPPDVAKALKEKGVWKHGEGTPKTNATPTAGAPK